MQPMSEYLASEGWNALAAAVAYARDLVKLGRSPVEAVAEAAEILGLPADGVMSQLESSEDV